MDYIITAISNLFMLVAFLILNVAFVIALANLCKIVKQLNRLEEEEDLEEETQEKREQITFTAIKKSPAKAEDRHIPQNETTKH